jgi:ketosteroid isomerase-like protein
VLRLCDEDIEIVQPPELPDVARQQRGHAGVLEAFAIWPQQWDDYEVEILGIAEIGAQVLVTTLQRGFGKGSGARVEARFSFLFSFRGGKIARWRMFMQEEQALEAARTRP